jgi:hypothetical protein
MKKKRRKRSPQKASRYRRVVGRLSHSMLAMSVMTVGLLLAMAPSVFAAPPSASFRCEIGRSCRISMPKSPTGPEPPL